MGQTRSSAALLAILSLAAALALCIDCARRQERPNILLIVIDALRPDHLGFNGHSRPTSPTIDRLAAQSVVFKNAISAASWTKPSFSSFLTGLYPCQHGVTQWESVMPDSIVTVAELLKQAGYGTGVIINIGTLSGRFNVFQGFDSISEATHFERDAVMTTDEAIKMIEGIQKPFFLLVHYIDVHWPYRAPVEYYDSIGERESFQRWGPVKGGDEFNVEEAGLRASIMYDACIRFVDDQVNRLLDFLADRGLRESTVLIVTADHGEAFWEHGTRAHAKTVYDEEIRVPLVLHYPKRYGHKIVSQQVSLVDLAPTIAAIANVKDTSHREGRNLLALIEKKKDAVPRKRLLPPEYDLNEVSLFRIPASKGIRSLKWKIMVEPSTGLIKIFDLENDPKEKVNLWESDLAIKDSLVSLLRRVPGTSVRGWRMAFTGSPKDKCTIDVKLPPQARISFIEPVVGDAMMDVKVDEDSTGFSVSVNLTPRRNLAMLWYDLEPSDAEVTLRVLDGKTIYVGAASHQISGEFVLSCDEGFGLPSKFVENRETATPGVYIWWLPGEHLISGRKSQLTPEEIKRLRALGYLQ